MKRILYTSLFLLSTNSLFGQIITREDSLSAGLVKSSSPTVISGYGNVKYSNNVTTKTATTNVERFILFVGHKFSKRLLSFLN
jgi:hypothetical protein